MDGQELTHVQTLRLGRCHSGSHANMPPSPVLWIIYGALDDTCDVTCSQATYQHISIAKITANNFRKSKDFLQTLRTHYAMPLRNNLLSAIMQNKKCCSKKFYARTIIVLLNVQILISCVKYLPRMFRFSDVPFFKMWNNIMVAAWKL
jgi:hypothetical protein